MGQDLIVMNLRNKSHTMAIRKESDKAFNKKMAYKKRANKQYSSLYNMAPPKQTYQSKKRGKHKTSVPKKLRRHKQRMFNLKTSTLNDMPFDRNRKQKSDEILITDMNKEKYLDLMKVNEQKIKQVAKHLNPRLAAFCEETMEKQKATMIDLTVDNFINDDIESTDIERMNESLKRLRRLIKLTTSPKQKRLRSIQLQKSPGRKIKSQFIAINIRKHQIKREKQRMYEKSNQQFNDDVYLSQKFETEYNAKQINTNKIIVEIDFIEEFKRKLKEKEEQEQRQKEREERLRKEEEAKALKLEQMESENEEDENETDTKLRDNKLCQLTQEEEDLIDRIFELPSNKIVGAHKGHSIEVAVKDLNTLEDGQWLNDEVMNFYMALLQDRNLKRLQQNGKNIRVLLMNTFFFYKIIFKFL